MTVVILAVVVVALSCLAGALALAVWLLAQDEEPVRRKYQ